MCTPGGWSACLPPPPASPIRLFHPQSCAETVLKEGDLAGVLENTSAQVDLKYDLSVVVLEEAPTEGVLEVVLTEKVLEDVPAEEVLGDRLNE